MQLLSIPAFLTYSWFCINHLAPLQCVFLCLTYLRYNRAAENGQIIRYFVDAVIDIFATSDGQLATRNTEGRESASADTDRSGQQVPLAWRKLVELRRKIDLPPGADESLFKPTTPIRCETLPAAIALRAMSLSTSETITDPPMRGAEPAPSARVTCHPTSNGHALPSAEPPITHDHDGRPGGNFGMDNMFDVSDLAAWSSSLIQDPHDDFHMGQDIGGEVNEATHPLFEWDVYPQASV